MFDSSVNEIVIGAGIAVVIMVVLVFARLFVIGKDMSCVRRRNASYTKEQPHPRFIELQKTFMGLSSDDVINYVISMENKFKENSNESESKVEELKKELEDAKHQIRLLNV